MKEMVRKIQLVKPIVADRLIIGRDHYFSDAYVIDFPLDSTPDHIWLSLFDKEWKSSRYVWDRKLFVIGDRLRLVTTYEGLNEKLDWIEQIIDSTNKQVDVYNKEEEAITDQTKEHVKHQVLEEETRIERIRDAIRKAF
jgi:hypothetical protein